MTLDSLFTKRSISVGVTLLVGLGVTLSKGDVPTNFLDLLIAILVVVGGADGVKHLAEALAVRRGGAAPNAQPAPVDGETRRLVNDLANKVDMQSKAFTNLTEVVLTAAGIGSKK